MKSPALGIPLFYGSIAFANHWIVDPNGTDLSHCGSVAMPCQSVNGALVNFMEPAAQEWKITLQPKKYIRRAKKENLTKSYLIQP